jgi:hypothetical protein
VLLHELYAPVQKFIDTHPPKDQAFKVEFTASLEAIDFINGIFSHVANNKRGSFYGAEQASALVADIMKDKDFDNWDSILSFLEKIHHALHYDLRPNEGEQARQVSEQIKSGSSVSELYDFIYQLEFIKYRQNLDNQSVFTVLVPFIKEARKRRQVFLITHNPNIAVVTGAEQVIFCEMDKSDGNHISYDSGSLESPVMNQHVLNVLEGTRPAFTSRDETYQISEDPRRSR